MNLLRERLIQIFKNVKLIQDERERMVIEFSVVVRPGSKKTSFTYQNEELKIHLNAPPVDGAANEGVRKLLAKQLGIAFSSCEIVKGELSRSKRLRAIFLFTDHKGDDYYVKKCDEFLEEIKC